MNIEVLRIAISVHFHDIHDMITPSPLWVNSMIDIMFRINNLKDTWVKHNRLRQDPDVQICEERLGLTMSMLHCTLYNLWTIFFAFLCNFCFFFFISLCKPIKGSKSFFLLFFLRFFINDCSINW